jgi:hypothetical protein
MALSLLVMAPMDNSERQPLMHAHHSHSHSVRGAVDGTASGVAVASLDFEVLPKRRYVFRALVSIVAIAAVILVKTLSGGPLVATATAAAAPSPAALPSIASARLAPLPVTEPGVLPTLQPNRLSPSARPSAVPTMTAKLAPRVVPAVRPR